MLTFLLYSILNLSNNNNKKCKYSLSSDPNKIYIFLSFSIVVLCHKSHEKYLSIWRKGQPRGYTNNLVFILNINNNVVAYVDKHCSSSINGFCCYVYGMIFIIHIMTFNHLLCYTTKTLNRIKAMFYRIRKY